MAKGYITGQKVRRVRAVKMRNIRITLFASLMYGIVRGIGMAIGFSGLAVVLIYITKWIPVQNIPFLQDLIDAIVNSKSTNPQNFIGVFSSISFL